MIEGFYTGKGAFLKNWEANKAAMEAQPKRQSCEEQASKIPTGPEFEFDDLS